MDTARADARRAARSVRWPEHAGPTIEVVSARAHYPVRRPFPWGVVLGIVVLALSLRGPIVAPSPILGELRADLGLSATTAGLLTSLPVLCFAVVTPLASLLIRRVGPELAVIACLLGVLAGTVLRSVGPAATVLAGTVVIGAAIMIGNIVVPVIVRRDVPWQRASTVTGAYTAALNVGSMLTSLGTASLAQAVGWRWALAAWGLLAVVGVLAWAWLARRRTATPATLARPEAVRPSARVSRIGWLLMVAFCGQSFAYYAVTAWLPTLLGDTRGLDPAASGATASLFQIAAIVGAFGVPVIAARAPGWVPVAVMAACWVALPVGLLTAPGAYALWSFLGGAAQGGGFTAILGILARVSRSDAEAASMSARVQAGGYVAAASGPPLLGALNGATGGWTLPLLVVLGATLVFTAAGLLAARGAARPG